MHWGLRITDEIRNELDVKPFAIVKPIIQLVIMEFLCVVEPVRQINASPPMLQRLTSLCLVACPCCVRLCVVFPMVIWLTIRKIGCTSLSFLGTHTPKKSLSSAWYNDSHRRTPLVKCRSTLMSMMQSCIHWSIGTGESRQPKSLFDFIQPFSTNVGSKLRQSLLLVKDPSCLWHSFFDMLF